MVRVNTFDASEYLDSEEVIAAYLTVALEDSNPDVFLCAVGNVAKVRGMTDVASREVGAYHPRTSGTHGKSLRLARENNIPLMHMLKMLSYTSAKNLGDAGLKSMQVRGRMQEGMVADIAVFDWDKVTDNSDYAEGKNGLPTTGVPYVLVSGTVVVEDSKVLKSVNPGQAIRYTPTKTSLFKKLENKGDWVTKAKYPH